MREQTMTVNSTRRLLHEVDWTCTPLGARASWSAALHYAVALCLNSGFPMLIWWGSDAIQLYNDAYIPLFGKRHPTAFGQRGSACWPEVWDIVGPLVEQTRTSGEPFTGEDMEFSLERNGFVENAFFTFSYSRIGSPDDGECGVLCTNIETTQNVLREREFRAMADTIANIIYTHAPDGTVEWANSRWYEYSGLPPEIAIRPSGWSLVMPATDYDALLAVLSDAFASGTSYETEVRFKPVDGDADDYRWFLLRAVPMFAADGTIYRWAGSATDVHDRHLIADALSAELEREYRASRAFQEAALPQVLPTIPGLTLSAVYEPAGPRDLVGGDWYDAFRLQDGRVVLSVGDVMGSGLPAAVTMAAVRQAIRGAAGVYPEPSTILDAADRTLRSEQPASIVTAFVGVVDPLTLTLTFACAGHPAPLVRHADGTIVELRAIGLPLGLRNERRHDRDGNGSIELRDDSLLVLYTDGLTEATRDVLEGEHRLRAALGSAAVYEAGDPAAALRRAVLAVAKDDVAILVVRVSVADHQLAHPRWIFPAHDAATAIAARREISQVLQELGATTGEAADAELIFGELLGNVVRHADGDVEAALELTADGPVLHVLDRGPGFTFFARLPKDTMSESGRGLYIATMLARDVTVTPRNDGGSHARAVLAVQLRGLDRGLAS